MDIAMDAKVYCTDGLCGHSTRVVVRPRTEEVTHLVVKEKEPPHREVLVPVSCVTATAPDAIHLGCGRPEIAQMQPFIEKDYSRIDVPRAAGGSYMTPYLYTEHLSRAVKHEAIPTDELAVRRGASVEATDGHVGHVDGFLVDPDTDLITHLVLREGHLWDPREVTIPVSEISRLGEHAVYLQIDKREIGALPHTARKRG